MSPLGSRTRTGIPASSASSITLPRGPSFRSRHPDDDAVRRQVAGTDDDLVAAGASRGRVDRVAEVERAAVGHGGRESRVGTCSTDFVSIRGRRRRSPSAIRPTNGREKDEGRGGRWLDERLDALQYRLYAEDRRSVLLILQGLDASGRTASSARSQAEPRARVVSFGPLAGARWPTTTCGRVHAALPKWASGVFNRSHYEDMVTVRLCALVAEEVWRPPGLRAHLRVGAMLVDEGTSIVKDSSTCRGGAAPMVPGADRRPPGSAGSSSLRISASMSRSTQVDAYEDALTETSTDGDLARRPGGTELGQGARRRAAPQDDPRGARSAAARARGRARRAPRGGSDASRGMSALEMSRLDN